LWTSYSEHYNNEKRKTSMHPQFLNTLLSDIGLNLETTRLLRHADAQATEGRTHFKLWRDHRSQFELYQSVQRFESHSFLEPATDWVSFVISPDGQTLLAGVYRARYRGLLEHDTPARLTDEINLAGFYDFYDLERRDEFAKYEGQLAIDWGKSPSRMDSNTFNSKTA
jgi:hypothetical protein